MHFLFVIWQRTKSILLFALIYLVVGVDCETYFLSKQSALVKQGISSPVSHQVESTQTFFEETEEADNEVLYFQKSNFIFFQSSYANLEVLTYTDFICFKSLIQNHLLNLPPPIFS